VVNDEGALPPVEHDETSKQFQLRIDGHLALIQYARSGDRIVFLHTEVPPPLEGRGVGGRLARAALDYARDHKLSVVSRCPFVAAYIRKHPEYQALVPPAELERILGPRS
jgi:predicted GNAT family acetyltransferase